MGIDVFDVTFRIEKEFDIPLPNDEILALVRNNDIRVGDSCCISRLSARFSIMPHHMLHHVPQDRVP